MDTYLRGANLISANVDTYYLFNGHGDVVNLSDANGSSTKTYEYDAFGVEQNIDGLDHNPFRYCAEYYDQETGTYYLRARYYDPTTGRFTQEDPHWGSANSIYGDTPMAAFQREDALGLTYTSYAPQIFAVQQSGNLYVYCVGNPVDFADPSGEAIPLWLISGAISAAMSGASYVFTTLSKGDKINFDHLVINIMTGFASGFFSSIPGLELIVYAIGNFIISWFTSYACGDTLTESLFSGFIGAFASYIPGYLKDLADFDEVSEIIVGITAGTPIEIVGDMIEIATDGSEDKQEAAIEESVKDEATGDAVDDTVKSGNAETPLSEDEGDEKDDYTPQPDPPEYSGGSPSGPGDYIGPDKRPIAF